MTLDAGRDARQPRRPRSDDGRPPLVEHPEPQPMQDMGVIDPENVDEALVRGAYAGLERALGWAQEEVIAEVTGSKLGGRGGGYFPTGRKWDFLRTSTTTPKAMVCNADEGDPGAWVNRMTMECDPHALIEGMMIGGWATGADRGYIYIREEYPLAFERMKKAVEQAYEQGHARHEHPRQRASTSTSRSCAAPAATSAAKSPGLIASIEDGARHAEDPAAVPGRRPASSARAATSTTSRATTRAAWVLRNGVEEWATLGTERNPAPRCSALSGNINRVGCFEMPFGTPIRDSFYEVCGGGAPEGHTVQGDPARRAARRRHRRTSALDLGDGARVYRENRARLPRRRRLRLPRRHGLRHRPLSQLHWFLEDESCGRCTTCHGGTQRTTEILRRIQRGGGRESDIGKLRLLADTLRYSNCFHGQLALATI